MEGSKVNTHRHHIGNNLWPLDFPSSWHCRCMNLYIFWMHTLVQLIWAQFHQNLMILKIWPLYKRSCTLSYFPLYLDNETSYGYHVSDFFLLFMTRGRIWDIFQPNWSILKFYPHIPFDLGFHGQYGVWKNASMFIWKFGPSSAFWYMNFQILIKWAWVYRSPYTINPILTNWHHRKKYTTRLWGSIQYHISHQVHQHVMGCISVLPLHSWLQKGIS